MIIKDSSWKKFIDDLRKFNEKAAELVEQYMETHDYSTPQGRRNLIEYAYAVATKYGEGAAEKACQMYDAMASKTSKKLLPPAEPAATATYGEIARTVNGTLLYSNQPRTVGSAVGRAVKQAGVDTTLKNALRDGAEWAWIPHGDTCPFCLMLASRGWVKASKKALKNGHASHVHANCDCTFAVRHDGVSTVEGYDPDSLYKQYKDAGDTPNERLNALRRQHYAANKDAINAQKRVAYAARKVREIVANGGENGIMKSTRISSPIASRKHPTGTPEGVAIAGDAINSRQRQLLTKLAKYDDRLEVDKRDVSMRDLAAMTAYENVEFAMFTRKGKRLLIRGERNGVNISPDDAKALAKAGYKWSGHTHPGKDYISVLPSDDDRVVLKATGRKYSVIYSATGRKYIFAVDEADDIGRKK